MDFTVLEWSVLIGLTLALTLKLVTQIRQSYRDYTTQHRRFEEQQASWEESMYSDKNLKNRTDKAMDELRHAAHKSAVEDADYLENK